MRATATLDFVMHHIHVTIWPAYPDDAGLAAVGWLVYRLLAVSVLIASHWPSDRRAGVGNRDGTPCSSGVVDGASFPGTGRRLLSPCSSSGGITGSVTGDLMSLKGVLGHALLLQDLINSPKPNGAFWSIAVEW